LFVANIAIFSKQFIDYIDLHLSRWRGSVNRDKTKGQLSELGFSRWIR